MNPLAQSRIEELLDRQIQVAQRLADVLETERDALTGDSPALVCEQAARKVHLLEEFEKLENERRRLSEDAEGPVPGVASMISQRWRSLMRLLAACRNANETNGMILNLRQGQVRQLLDVIRGGPAITYGPQGQTFGSAMRPLARV